MTDYHDQLFCTDCDDRVYVEETTYAAGGSRGPRDSVLTCRNCGSDRLSDAGYCTEHKCYVGEGGCPTCKLLEEPADMEHLLRHLLRACANPNYGISKTILRAALPSYLHKYVDGTPLPPWVDNA